MTWLRRVKDASLGLLVVLGVVAALFTAAGSLTFLRHASCDRLDAERVSHLEPGFETPGPGSIHVLGVGPGPPKSQIVPYLEAEQAMVRAGCDVPALVGPSPTMSHRSSGAAELGRGTGIARPVAPRSDVSFAVPARSSISIASWARRTRSRLSATAVCSRCVPEG